MLQQMHYQCTYMHAVYTQTVFYKMCSIHSINCSVLYSKCITRYALPSNIITMSWTDSKTKIALER